MIIKEDVALLRRVGKILADEAEVIRVSNEPFTKDPESVVAKRRYDRYLRERRDLKALEKRVEQAAKRDALFADHPLVAAPGGLLGQPPEPGN